MAPLESLWRSVYADCAFRSPFASWEWVTTWWNHFSRGNARGPLVLYPLAVYNSANSELIGLAPFHYTKRGRLEARRHELRLLGDMGTEPALSEELPVIFRKSFEDSGTRALLRYLSGPARKHWNTLHLTIPCERGMSDEALSDRRACIRGRLTSNRIVQTEYLPLPTQWDELRQTLSKSTRDNLTYYPRLLSRHNLSWAVRRVADPMDIEDAANILVNLHRLRAQSTVGHPHMDHLPGRVHHECLRQALIRLTLADKASVWLLDVDGRTVAAQAVLQDGSELCMYYSGFDPAYRAYSLLTILHAEIIKTGIQERIAGINFLPGHFQYKSRWGARSVRRSLEIRKVNSDPMSLVRTLLHMAFTKLARNEIGPRASSAY